MEKNIFPQEYLNLIGAISQKLMARQRMLGTAESCTGGLLAALCTELPGSSQWFTGSVVSYANEIKHTLLHVPLTLLEEHGAVSRQVVEAMAVGGLDALKVDTTVAFSGIAGPDGGTQEKPVGTVWIAVACRERSALDHVVARLHHFSGTRTEIRLQAVYAGLTLLAESLPHND